MQVLEDVVTLALVVSIQLGVPITVLFVIGYMRYRGNPSRREPLPGHLGASAGIAGELRDLPAFSVNHPCWDVMHCSPEMNWACPARQHPMMPCWQANRTPLGHVRAKCVNCDRFLSPPSHGSIS